jgi:hypothetical protein
MADPVSPAPRRDDLFASELRGFGPAGIVAIMAILISGNVTLGQILVLPVGGVLVLVWVWRSGTSWAAIGYGRPGSWVVTVLGGIAFGVALKLISKTIVMPLLGAPTENPAYQFLAGNRGLLPTAVWAMLAAGFGEETIFRGYMFERLGKLFPPGPRGKAGMVLITTLWFALGHYSNMGWYGVEQALLTGTVFGVIAAITGRVWFVMVAHATFDLAALALIYGGWETQVAHWIFST